MLEYGKELDSTSYMTIPNEYTSDSVVYGLSLAFESLQEPSKEYYP